MAHAVHSIDDLILLREQTGASVRNAEIIHTNAAATTIEMITDRKQFYQLEHEWNALARWTGNPLVQFEWYASCVEAFEPEIALCCIVVRQNKTITAIAPLAFSTVDRWRKIELLGSSRLCEPAALIYLDLDSLKLLINAILELRVPFISGRLGMFSPESDFLRQAKENRSLLLTMHHETASPWLPITMPWNEYESRISPSRRSALRRAERRAKEYGEVTMEIVSPDVHSMQVVLNEIYDVEHASWKGKSKTSIRSNPLMENFFNLYAKKMTLIGVLRLYLMRVNKKVVAAQIAVEYSDRLWVLKVGFDEHFAHCSPGILLMHHVVHDAFERGLRGVEFLGSTEPWLRMWTEKKHLYTSFRMYPITSNGLLCMATDGRRMLSAKMKQYFYRRENGGAH